MRKDKSWFLVEIRDGDIRWFMLIRRIHIVLMVATFLTTTFAGAVLSGANPFSPDIIRGLWFSLPLLTIISLHELGHILMMRKERMVSSFPYFIPAPNIVGTFGAIMVMVSKPNSASKVIRVGFAGPLMSFIFSFPFALLGLYMSEVVEPEVANQGTFSVKLGAPLVFLIIEKLVWGDGIDDKVIMLHPLAFSGWVGFFITALNLIPIGQTDGGHILGGILGRIHRFVSFIFSGVFIILGVLFWVGWILWGVLTLFLTLFTSPHYFEMKRDVTSKEIFILFLSALIFALCFTPNPIEVELNL